jgi:hypothetical protein
MTERQSSMIELTTKQVINTGLSVCRFIVCFGPNLLKNKARTCALDTIFIAPPLFAVTILLLGLIGIVPGCSWWTDNLLINVVVRVVALSVAMPFYYLGLSILFNSFARLQRKSPSELEDSSEPST